MQDRIGQPEPMFQPGDRAVHPAHGVGEVTAVEERDAGGATASFYVLRILESGLKVMVSVAAAASSGLRPVMSRSEADQVLAILKTPEVAASAKPWTRRHRMYQDMLKSGSPYEIAKVLRDMYRLRSDKDLSFAERKLFDQAKGLLIHELALANGVETGAMELEIQAIFSG